MFPFTNTAPRDLRLLHRLRASLSAVLPLAIAKKAPAYLEEVQPHPSHRQDSVSESVPAPPLAKKLTRKKMRKRRRSRQLLLSQKNPNLEALTSPVWRQLQMRRRVKQRRSRPAPEDSTSLGSTNLQRQRLLQQQRNGHARECRSLSSATSDQKR